MLIGIDASRALRKQRTGTEVHNAEIIKQLTKIDSKNSYRLYSSMPPSGDLEHLTGNIEWRVMPFLRGWTLFRLSLEMLTRPPDVLFVPAHTLPLITPRRSVVMIHDLGFDHFPDIYKWTDITYHHYAIRFAKQFATHILTPSEFTRQDLHQRYRIPLKKITAVHHGFDASNYRPARPNETSPMEKPYFYFIGRLEYKKNISRMLEAFKIFKEETGLPHQFVLAGKPAFGYEAIQNSYESLGGYKQDVLFPGYVPQDKAITYLRHAHALVFTTLFEGFGFPVLEAFASEVPVITSNTTSLPEIAGDAALLVDPTSVEAIAQAMVYVAQDQNTRQSLVSKGRERMTHFSWEKAGRETLTVLEKVGARA